ncbi:MAG: radical SAM protein, partial [Endomicrobia bacterium]|nr:radical SAM protein [Endomicrobiia bacterium]
MERKSLLYKTEVEYGDWTINHIIGCKHGCKFPCYAMMMAKKFGWVK